MVTFAVHSILVFSIFILISVVFILFLCHIYIVCRRFPLWVFIGCLLPLPLGCFHSPVLYFLLGRSVKLNILSCNTPLPNMKLDCIRGKTKFIILISIHSVHSIGCTKQMVHRIICTNNIIISYPTRLNSNLIMYS